MDICEADTEFMKALRKGVMLIACRVCGQVTFLPLFSFFLL
jgi:uncharacterized OB-fold protein